MVEGGAGVVDIGGEGVRGIPQSTCDYDPTLGEGPSHWQSTTLGEICKKGNGHIQTGPFGSQLHSSDYVTNGVPTIMPVNIGDKKVIEKDIKRIRESDAERLKRHRVIEGDIVYSRRGDVERHALVVKNEEGWLCGTGCLKVRLGDGVLPKYISSYLSHPLVKNWISRHAVGSTMPNLNTTILSSLPVLVPPIDEQRAIASVLGALDDKIELNRQMNHTLEQMAQALYKSWFVDFDPVTAKAAGKKPFGMSDEVAELFPDRFVESEMGMIPEGWRVSTIRSIAEYVNG